MLKVSIPLNVLSFKVSYPRAAYSDGSVETVDNLHHRIQCSRELPSGDEFLLVFITKYLFDLGWMLAMENKSLFVFLCSCTSSRATRVRVRDTPKQKNFSDCGAFTCMFGRCLAFNNPLNFTQQDIPCIRRHIALELLLGELIN